MNATQNKIRMPPSRRPHDKLPYYLLPQPHDAECRQWLGFRLKARRGKHRSEHEVAAASGVPVETILKIEGGDFPVPLGSFYEILRDGYGVFLPDLLEKMYDDNRPWFDPREQRPFNRDFYYRCEGRDTEGFTSTPMLSGGDFVNYVWAIPLRRLRKQPMVTEFLELASRRKSMKHRGTFPDHIHSGAEVVYVIHGSVKVQILGGNPPYKPELEREDLIHFVAGREHHIANLETNLTALLLVVRVLS